MASDEVLTGPEAAIMYQERLQALTADQEAQVVHPKHYNSSVPGIECIDVIQHFNLNKGTAIKYIWRAGHKDDEIVDLRKAIEYIEFEIGRVLAERARDSGEAPAF